MFSKALFFTVYVLLTLTTISFPIKDDKDDKDGIWIVHNDYVMYAADDFEIFLNKNGSVEEEGE